MNEKKNLTRGLESVLNKLPISDGKLRFSTDTGRLFLDNNNSRIEITDFVKGLSEKEIESIITPLPKFYYAYDTERFLYHNGIDWIKTNNHVEFADSDGEGNNIKTTYAPLKSPSLSGKPTTPTPADDDSNNTIVNKEYVNNSIDEIKKLLTQLKEYIDLSILNAVGGISQIKYIIVNNLPSTGEIGTIYFVNNNSSDQNNMYDEYIWIDNKFELIGPMTISFEFDGDYGNLDD